MSKHEGCVRGFHHMSATYYGREMLRGMDYSDEVVIGFYDEQGGGTSGEFTIKWVTLGGESVPKLQLFSDAWDALFQMQDLMAALSELDASDPAPSQICDLLIGLGFTDFTRREMNEADRDKHLDNLAHKVIHALGKATPETVNIVFDRVIAKVSQK